MADVPRLRGHYGYPNSRHVQERGQGTVEWVGVLAVVALLLVRARRRWRSGAGQRRWRGLLLRGFSALRRWPKRCGDEPALIAAYGSEVGQLVRRHMPTILFERGSRALPVDFRRCRSSECADGSARGLVHESDAGLSVTAFVHVVDCRPDAVEATRKGRCRLRRLSRRQPLPAVLDLLRRLGHHARRSDRRAQGLSRG